MRVDRKAMCEWFLKTIGMNLLIHECPAEPMGDKHVHEFSLIFYDGGSILNLMYYIIKKAANNGKPLKRVRITPHRYFKECMNYLSDEWFESETVENDFLVTATIVMNFKAGFSDESNRLHMIDFITGYNLHSEIWEFEINQAEPVVHALEQFSHRTERTLKSILKKEAEDAEGRNQSECETGENQSADSTNSEADKAEENDAE